jgi:hypothetical protein
VRAQWSADCLTVFSKQLHQKINNNNNNTNMEVSFSKSGDGGALPASAVEIKQETHVVEGVPVESTTTAVVPASEQQLAPGGLVLGDRLPAFKDIILPRINIVQGVGLLKDSFPFGSIVFNQQVVLFTPPDIDKQTGNIKRAGTPPVVLTVLGFRPTRYAEKVSGGARGLIVDSEDAVRANGGTLDYNEWKLKQSSGMKRFEPLADALVAIERPASITDDDTVFVYAVDGKKYALAIWGLKGTAYTAAAKRVFFTARAMGCLRGGYPTYSFNVSTRSETRESNTYSIPVCLPAQKSTPAFLEFVASVLKAPETGTDSRVYE